MSAMPDGREPKCAYCFAPIRGEVHTVRGRTYHPPRMIVGRSEGGCARLDTPLVPERKPPKVNDEQMRLEA